MDSDIWFHYVMNSEFHYCFEFIYEFMIMNSKLICYIPSIFRPMDSDMNSGI